MKYSSLVLLTLATAACAPRVNSSPWPVVAVTAASAAATSLDLHTTFQCHSDDHCRETNPVAGIFYDRHNPGVLVSADAIAVGALAMLGHSMYMSHSSFLRKTWWIPQAAFILESVMAWRANVRYLHQCGVACR